MKFTEFLNNKFGKKVYEQYRDDDDPDEQDWAPEPPKKKGKKGEDEKEEKVMKTFNVGDVITLVDTKKSTKIPPDAWDFLMVFKEFTVRKINDKGKIDLGCHISKNTPEGGVEKIYMFSPNRFELKTPAPITTVATAQPAIESEIKPISDEEGNEQTLETDIDPAEI
jgi:hypothetical protein